MFRLRSAAAASVVLVTALSGLSASPAAAADQLAACDAATAPGLQWSAPSFLAWDKQGPWVAGGALAVAGLYQLTPLKSACLRHCRSPLHFLLRGRPGALGALWMGIEHGGICVGCCAGLMLALFALGVMSLVWMAVVSLAILIEKVLPGGPAFARLLVVVLVALGIWVAASPDSVPGLTQPGTLQVPMNMGMGIEP